MADGRVLTGPVDWEAVMARTYFASTECWRTCGSFCCTHELEDFKFQLILTGGSNLFYLEEEYKYLSCTEPGLPAGDVAQELKLDFGGSKELRILQRPCMLKGACSGCIEKPLHCRLYPFIPEFNLNGELLRLNDASVFDVTFSAMGWSSPCTVRDTREEALTACHKDPDHLAPLRHPYLMFHFSCYGVFLDSYIECLEAETSLQELKGAKFWQRWEILYLSGRLLDWEKIRSGIHDLEVNYNDLYGIPG
jgi:hypothetical protein